MKLLSRSRRMQQAEQQRTDIQRSLIHWEAKLGGELFGPVPDGSRREFFCLDEKTWLWHEEWNDAAGHHTLTTRYDVRPDGIVKSQGDKEQLALSAEETHNLCQAIIMYSERVLPQLDGLRLAV